MIPKEGVTEIFVTQVTPGKELEYRAWNARMNAQESTFPGFRGVHLQAPHQSGGANWVTLLQFDTVAHLERWLESAERKRLLEEGATYMVSFDKHRVISPFSSWFQQLPEGNKVPQLWKQAMLILLVLFPIVMLEIGYLNGRLQGLNLSLSTFIGNTISVALITWPMMPLAVWAFSSWLQTGGRKGWIGTGVVLMLYVAEIALFWV